MIREIKELKRNANELFSKLENLNDTAYIIKERLEGYQGDKKEEVEQSMPPGLLNELIYLLNRCHQQANKMENFIGSSDNTEKAIDGKDS